MTILGPVLRECFLGEVTFEKYLRGREEGITGLWREMSHSPA